MMEGGGDVYRRRLGTRRDVWMGYAHRTGGGLMRGDMMLNPHRRLVSRRASDLARMQGRLGGFLGRTELNPLYRAGFLRYRQPLVAPRRRRLAGLFRR